MAIMSLLRLDRCGAIISEIHIQRIAVVGAISDQIFGLGFDHAEIEA